MRLDFFRTLWGDARPWADLAAETRAAGFVGVEARVPATEALVAREAVALEESGLDYIGIALTGGGVIPRQAATIREHVDDLEAILARVGPLRPRFINVLGGNDRWTAHEQAEFIARALEAAARAGVLCVFETHRARILATPWVARDVMDRAPREALFTADMSHWVVTSERLLDDPLDDFSAFIARVHHIQARIGYDQGPQVPHPAAPEHAAARAFHRNFWEQVWESQMARGYAVSTMTPECGPDGYTHTLPFTNAPVADHGAMNQWIARTERAHFEAFRAGRGTSSDRHQGERK